MEVNRYRGARGDVGESKMRAAEPTCQGVECEYVVFSVVVRWAHYRIAIQGSYCRFEIRCSRETDTLEPEPSRHRVLLLAKQNISALFPYLGSKQYSSPLLDGSYTELPRFSGPCHGNRSSLPNLTST